MDPCIQTVEQHLKDGYCVHALSIIQVADPQSSTQIQMTLKKSDDVITVTTSDSEEFFEYALHFKPARNTNGTTEFLYIDDLNQYYSPGVASEKGLYKEHHILSISGYTFSEGIITQSLIVSDNRYARQTGVFWIDLEKNPDFRKVDLKDPLSVSDTSGQVLLKGLVKTYRFSDTYGIITIQDLSLKLENKPDSAELVNLNGVDTRRFIAQSSGISAPGLSGSGRMRQFIIIIPICNAVLDEPLTIANIDFYQDFVHADDILIRNSKTGQTVPSWNGNFPRAKTEVTADTFFDAIMKGYQEVSQALDVLALCNDFSFPSLPVRDQEIRFHFQYHTFLSRVKIDKFVYCREKETKSHIFFNIEDTSETILHLDADVRDNYAHIYARCEHLFQKKNLTKKEKNLVHTLRWLRRAIQEGNEIDKFLGLWIAFEFILSKEHYTPLFTEEDIGRINTYIEESDFSTLKKTAILAKIKMLNDMPLMAKFDQVVTHFAIDISPEEREILNLMRHKRSDIVHGKQNITVTDEELNKMRTIIERIFLAKAGALLERV